MTKNKDWAKRVDDAEEELQYLRAGLEPPTKKNPEKADQPNPTRR